ncbi:acyl-CoA synthetase [soil metagenome]
METQGFPDLPQSTYALIERSARLFGDQTAISFVPAVDQHRAPVRHSYRDLWAGVTRTANLFHAMGLQADDVIAIILPGLAETHFIQWGAEATGIALPINSMLESSAIADLLRRSEARAVVTVASSFDAEVHRRVLEAISGAPEVVNLVLIESQDSPGGGSDDPIRPEHLGGPVETTLYNQAMAAQSGSSLNSQRHIRSEEIASMFCTGGTTGAPKLAQHTHGNEVANAWMTAMAIGPGYVSGDTVLCGLPLFHVNAAVISGLAAFYRGVNVLLVTPQGFRGSQVIQRFWEIVDHHRVAAFSAVPTLFTSLIQQPFADYDLSCLKFALCAASPMSIELMNQVERLTGVTIVEAYGLTEATCTVSMNPLKGERRVGSVGLPLPFEEIRIVVRDPISGLDRLAEDGETGSVVVAGPHVFPGYLSEQHNIGLWVDQGDDRKWLDTGDLGVVDVDGYLWLKGRTKDLIIRSGHNLDPAMIEDAFYAHPSVAMAAAIGRDDDYAGEVPVVYVQLREGHHVGADDLADFARSRIHERPAWPKEVIVIETLPLTVVGKVFKPTLRKMDQARRDGVKNDAG